MTRSALLKVLRHKAARLVVLTCLIVLPACSKQSDTTVSIAVHPADPRILYVSTNESVYKTRDSGGSWERMATDPSTYRVLSLALDLQFPATVYAGTTGGAYRSTDGTETWQQINTGLIPQEVLDASLALGVNTLVIDPQITDTVYAGTTKGLFKTTNRGDSWTCIGQSLADQYVSCLVVDPTNPNVLYAGGRAGVQKSFDGGQSWQVMNEGLETVNIRTLSISPLHAQTLFAGINGSGLYRSDDGAKTWKRLRLVTAPTGPGSSGT